MIYKDLLINKHIFDNLLKYKATNKLPNAFIFHGQEGSGKEGHAIEFFAALNCQENKTKACGFCKSCTKTKKLQHENLEIIFPLPRTKALSKNDSPLKGLTDNQKDKVNKENINKEVSINTVKHKIILKKNEFKKKNKTQNKAKPINISDYFSYLVVFVISFVSLIILLDTLKTPLVNIFPSLKIILSNLFETLKDIKLFIIDLT